MQSTKQLLLQALREPLPQALQSAIALNASARGTSECREGVQAFLEKRPPNF
jgi:enoyl-CoA hydratase/carnithine racemase